MHGLINRSIQHFLCDTYGASFWSGVATDAGLAATGFEAMHCYDDALTFAIVDAATARLRKPASALWEDFGIFLVSLEPLRRLLRFGGVDFADFLSSLDELPERAGLAVSDIGLPTLEVSDAGGGLCLVRYGEAWDGFGHALTGVLRAVADDYGALVLIEHDEGGRRVEVELLDAEYAEGRGFLLAAGGLR